MNTNKQNPTAQKKPESKQYESSESQEGNSASSKRKIEKIAEFGPFTIVKAMNMWHICLGNEVCAKKAFKTVKKAEDYINEKSWELIFTATAVFQKRANELQQKLKEMEKGA